MGQERHAAPENIAKFFDPISYRSQKRVADDTSSSGRGAKRAATLSRDELLEKFKLAAQLNGVDWDDLMDT